MGIFGNKKDETPSLFSRIGTTALVASRHGFVAGDAYSASVRGNPSQLGTGMSLEKGQNEGFFFDPGFYMKP